MRRPPRLLAALCAVLAAGVVLTACGGGGSGAADQFRFHSATGIGTVIPPAQRKPAADLNGPLLGGGRGSLATHKGKIVVMAFWASWCGPCRVELPSLQTLHEQYGSQGVDFLGVDSRDAGNDGRAFLKANGITFPSLVDADGDLAADLGNIPAALPFTVLVDAKGKVAAVYVQRYAPKDLEQALTTLRAET